MAEQTKTRIRPSEKQEASEEVVENRLAGKGEHQEEARQCPGRDRRRAGGKRRGVRREL